MQRSQTATSHGSTDLVICATRARWSTDGGRFNSFAARRVDNSATRARSSVVTHHRVNLDRLVGRTLKGKTDARTEAENLRGEIRAGRFRHGQEAAPGGSQPLTFSDIGPIFLERYSKAREKRSWHQDELLHARIAAAELVVGDRRSRIGDKPLVSITADDVESFLQDVRARGRAASTYNHYRQYLRALFGRHARATSQGIPSNTPKLAA